MQELKEWMSLLSYESSGLGETIGPAYASTANFLQFGSFGAAVEVRNLGDPLMRVGQLAGTLSALQGAP